jgi:hypothetical protein
MFEIQIRSGPIELKIRGADGMTTGCILDQMNQGARLVLYHYAVSFVVFSSLRPSDVFCILPGRSRLIPGLRYTLLSVLVGWWSLPSGIIFTIQALSRNCRGGLDVTDAIRDAVATAPKGSAPRLLLQDSGFVFAPPLAAVVHDLTRAAAAVATRRRNVKFCLLVLSLFVAIFAAAEVYRVTHYPLALINGTDRPYTVVLDGKPMLLAPNSAQVLAVVIGKHITHSILPDGSVHICEFEAGSYRYDLTEPHYSTIVNPDRRALIVELHQVYGKSTPTSAIPTPRIWAAHEVLTIKRPHYFFVSFPTSVEAPAGANVVQRQIALIPDRSHEERVKLITEYGSLDDLHNYRHILSAP